MAWRAKRSKNVPVDKVTAGAQLGERDIGARDKKEDEKEGEEEEAAGMAWRAKRSNDLPTKEVPGVQPKKRDGEPTHAAAGSSLNDPAALALETCRQDAPKSDPYSCANMRSADNVPGGGPMSYLEGNAG